MTEEQERALKASEDLDNSNKPLPGGQSKITGATSEKFIVSGNESVLSADQTEEEVTNNDGSIIETLDTAFHNKPGYIKDHSIAGSNRADYYEARSQGKSDVEEEQDFLRQQQPEQ